MTFCFDKYIQSRFFLNTAARGLFRIELTDSFLAFNVYVCTHRAIACYHSFIIHHIMNKESNNTKTYQLRKTNPHSHVSTTRNRKIAVNKSSRKLVI